jgi:hypothetical protein
MTMRLLCATRPKSHAPGQTIMQESEGCEVDRAESTSLDDRMNIMQDEESVSAPKTSEDLNSSNPSPNLLPTSTNKKTDSSISSEQDTATATSSLRISLNVSERSLASTEMFELPGADGPDGPGAADSRRKRNFQHQNHSLRISVSELAACVGYHPFRTLPKVAMDHVYQGSAGQALLRHDAQLLGLPLISERQALLDIAQQAGAATQQALQSALQVQTGEKKVQSVETAEKLRQTVVQEAKKSKKLSKEQLATLQEGARHSINTGFGNSWESQALDLYERQCGWEVQERNTEIRMWPFDENGREIQSAYAYRRLDNATTSTSTSTDLPPPKRQKNTIAEIIDLVVEKDEKIAAPEPQKACFFSLRGAVDGIREELAPSNIPSSNKKDDDDDSWILRRIIVECKHRMSRLQASPPLYEMIQTTAYCLMYEAEEADLVQVLRRQQQQRRPTTRKQKKNEAAKDHGKSASNKLTDYFENKEATNGAKDASSQSETAKSETDHKHASSGNKDEKAKEESKAPDEKIVDAKANDTLKLQEVQPSSKENESSPSKEDSPTLQISVHRISLEDPLLQHRYHWDATILPRLRSWVEAVYSIRRDDDKRYRLLTAVSSENLKEAWEIVFDECPWLRDGDTSYLQDMATR